MDRRTAFIVAAGKGTRMMPLTEDRPKPMVMVNGRPILDYIYDHLMRAGVDHIILNTHYKAACIDQWADKKRSENKAIKITTTFEEELLETGGGLVNVIRSAGLETSERLLMINGDAFWTNGASCETVSDLLQNWESVSNASDMSLVMQPIDDLVFGEISGDYDVLDNGVPKRSLSKSGRYMFTGIRIVNPKALLNYSAQDKKFSFLKMMDEAEAKGRLNAYIHHGLWYHLSTPDDIIKMEHILEHDKGKALTVK